MNVINEPKLIEDAKKYKKFLETFSEERAIRDLNRSQATFEKDEYGNKITIGPDEEGMQEYKKIHYRAVDHILDNHIKDYLRTLIDATM